MALLKESGSFLATLSKHSVNLNSHDHSVLTSAGAVSGTLLRPGECLALRR